MLQVAGADILDMPPSGMAASMHALAVSTLPCSTAEWNEGGCVIDTSCLKGHATAALRDWCRTTRGVVCLEWLPYLSLSTLQLYDSNGGQVDVRTALPLLAAPDTIIGDVLNWSHINSDHLAFQALCGGLPVSKISSSRAAQLSRLIALLICNFPSIVYATACHLELRMLSPQQDHPHILTPPSLASPTHALLTTVGSSSSYPLLAFSSPGLLAEAHRATGSTARITGIHPHPTIARLGCLWVGHRRWKRDCKHYKAVAAAVSREKGKVNLQQRALDWALEAPCAHRALERLQWTDIRRIVGISSWGERLLYRIKVRGLNLFQRTSGRRSCPHAGCSATTTTLTHVFWECPAAGHLWGYFFGGWQALGHHGDLQVPASLLQFYLSVVPPGFFTRLDQEFSWYQLHARNEVAQHIPDAVAKCWKIGLAIVVEVIWKWRCEYLDCDPHPSARRFQAALAVRLRQAYRTVAASFHEIGGSGPATTAARLVANALNANYSTIPFPLSSADSVFVLFFDGGSRGNPGPGGSGTVILQVERGAELGHPIWIASMAYGDKRTTNNTAEYRGLLHGLKHAKRAGLRPLHVVGDSQMIINQMDRRRPPRVGHLARLYWQCRNLADECGVTTWIHHYCSFNKTADALANLAMDTKVSRQMGGDDTGIPPGCKASLRHTQMDLNEWQTRVEVCHNARSGLVILK